MDDTSCVVKTTDYGWVNSGTKSNTNVEETQCGVLKFSVDEDPSKIEASTRIDEKGKTNSFTQSHETKSESNILDVTVAKQVIDLKTVSDANPVVYENITCGDKINHKETRVGNDVYDNENMLIDVKLESLDSSSTVIQNIDRNQARSDYLLKSSRVSEKENIYLSFNVRNVSNSKTKPSADRDDNRMTSESSNKLKSSGASCTSLGESNRDIGRGSLRLKRNASLPRSVSAFFALPRSWKLWHEHGSSTKGKSLKSNLGALNEIEENKTATLQPKGRTLKCNPLIS